MSQERQENPPRGKKKKRLVLPLICFGRNARSPVYLCVEKDGYPCTPPCTWQGRTYYVYIYIYMSAHTSVGLGVCGVSLDVERCLLIGPRREARVSESSRSAMRICRLTNCLSQAFYAADERSSKSSSFCLLRVKILNG